MRPILETLELVGPRLPAEWVSDSALRRIRSAAGRLPPGAAVCFIERRFGPRNRRVDFGLCYPYPAHQAALLGGHRLGRRIPFLWLEVDGARVSDQGRPGALLCVDAALGQEAFGRAVPRLSEKTLLELGAAGYRHFVRDTPPRALRENLRKCFLALPVHGRVIHLSFMPSRSPPVTKLNVVLPKRSLAAYLEKVDWPGDFTALDNAWRRIAPSVERAKIDLTIGPSLQPKLGLEVVPSNASVAGRRAVLDWLAHEGLIEPRQSKELAAWHGKDWRMSKGQPTSIEFDFGMKIVLDAASKLDAKAYLHFTSETEWQ